MRTTAPLLFVIALVFAGTASVSSAQVSGTCVANCGSAPPPYVPPPPPPRAGAVANVSGDVTIIYPNGTRHSADAGAPVPIGSRIVTGPTGKLQVLLLDETVFTITGSSEFVIDDFVYDPTSSVGKFLATITKGVFRFITGHVTRHDPDNWRIKTPAGAVGIRGTTFDLVANPDGSGEISVDEGQVVLSEYDTNRDWVVDAGHKLTIENFKVVGVQ